MNGIYQPSSITPFTTPFTSHPHQPPLRTTITNPLLTTNIFSHPLQPTLFTSHPLLNTFLPPPPAGKYPALAFRLHMTRRLSYMLLQVYLPSGLFVVVSFVSLLVPSEAIPGRMTLCITTILTMSALLGVAM